MRQKLSKEKIVERFKKQNLELLSEYTTANTKVLVKCLKCGYEWKVYPKHVFSGHSCPKCAGNKLSKNDILKRIEKKNLTLLSEIDKIKNKNSIIKVKCKKCGFIYETKLGNIYRGQGGCRKCAKNLKLTQKEAIEKFNELGFELLSEYTSMQTKVKVKCKQCEAIYETTPSNILVKKRGCKECFRKSLMLDEKIVREKFAEQNLELISGYHNCNTKVTARCMKCGYVREVVPASVIYKNVKCPKCSNIKRKLEIIDWVYPYSVFRGKSCFKCNIANPKWEDEIKEILENYGYQVIKNYQLKGRKEIDLFLPEYKLGLELNGLYWHSYSPTLHNSFTKDKYKAKWHLYNKKMEALEKDINIIFIFEHEYHDKFLFNKILNFILTKLNYKKQKIYGRKCKLKEVNNNQAFDFYNKYHILGAPTFCKHFALLNNDEIVSLMSFRKEKGEWIITRYACKNNIIVLGGFKKLLINSMDILNIETVVSFLDLRFIHPINNTFIRNGFTEIGKVEPRYFYWRGTAESGFDILERRQAQKSNLKKFLPEFNPNLTEEENVFKFYRGKCYDAGKIKVKYSKSCIK